jgi:hypothetical protein
VLGSRWHLRESPRCLDLRFAVKKQRGSPSFVASGLSPAEEAKLGRYYD